MKFDVFFSICQTPVDGPLPSEKVMWDNFFREIKHADQLGFGTAWIAETHLSCQVQKENPAPVIPHFEGEIGLNTDILQLAHVLFSETKSIEVGSAIRNIQCNGGPIAHAEAVRTFLALHGRNANENRKLHLGFAAGRFPFSNIPYGIRPRNDTERVAWSVVRGKIFQEAVEIFLRFIKGEVFSSRDLKPCRLRRSDFRSEEEWQRTVLTSSREHQTFNEKGEMEIRLEPRWYFDKVGIVPREVDLKNLELTIGAHDPETQILANQFYPVGVFNLSITPAHVIEETHERMSRFYHAAGGAWKRSYMPRTVLVFVDDTPGLSREKKDEKAKELASRALATYWKAMEGTLDPEKIKGAVENALAGSPETIEEQIRSRFHPDDRLMLWFDFFNHDSQAVMDSMSIFKEKVMPRLKDFRQLPAENLAESAASKAEQLAK